MELVSISCEQSRLNFFRDQLAAANRRLDWSMKHNPDCRRISHLRMAGVLHAAGRRGGEKRWRWAAEG